MNLQHAARQATVSHERHHEADTHLHGRWLLLARIVWLALVAFVLGLFVVSLPGYVAHFYRVRNNTVYVPWQQASPASAQALQHLGFSLGVYAPFASALSMAIVLVWVVVGAVIFWRKSDDWMALLTAFGLIAWGTTFISGTFQPDTFAGQFALQWLGFLRNAALALFVFLFPSGRFVPGWTRWYAMLGIATIGAEFFFPASPLNIYTWPPPLNSLSLITPYLIIVGAQMYRYQRVSNVIEREQTRWVVFALAIVFLGVAGYVVVDGLLKLHLPTLLAAFLYPLIRILVPLLVPISIGIAILRSRLYDIDIIINRTLVYGSLTALLALLYFGLIIGLQSLVHLVTGTLSEQPLVIVASTLAIYALFWPLRRRIQIVIDRRFYRRKYDAAKTLEAFSATLRSEVDLSQLREHVLHVVEETMQPTSVSLWLRPPEQDGKQRLLWRTRAPLGSEER